MQALAGSRSSGGILVFKSNLGVNGASHLHTKHCGNLDQQVVLTVGLARGMGL